MFLTRSLKEANDEIFHSHLCCEQPYFRSLCGYLVDSNSRAYRSKYCPYLNLAATHSDLNPQPDPFTYTHTYGYALTYLATAD